MPTMAKLSPVEERARLVLRKLKAWWELSDDEIGRLVGLSRQSVSYRLSGRLKIGMDDLEAFAEGLGVPRDLFFMPPNDAIRWVMAREEDQIEAVSVVPIRSTNVRVNPLSLILQAAA